MLVELWKPPASKLNTFFILGEMIFSINALAEIHPNIDTDMLRALLEGIRANKVETEDGLRALCQIFRDTYSFDYSLQELGHKTREQVSSFVDGQSVTALVAKGFDTGAVLGDRQNHSAWHKQDGAGHQHVAQKVVDKVKAKLSNLPVIHEDVQGSKIMEVHSDVPFTDWALDVRSRPAYTFVPTTVLGLQNLIKSFKGRRIRCSGYRHSRAPLFPDEGDILVSMLPLKQVTSLPDPSALVPDAHLPVTNELRSIQVFPVSTDAKTMHVRVGAAVSSEELRQRAVKDGWTMPTDVNIGEITMGGMNCAIAHGSGLANKTLNDQVRIIEYVDAHGVLQSVSSREELSAAAACFGLLGIVTHITFEVRQMAYAIMKPRKIATMLAIPPIDMSTVPEALQLNATADQVSQAVSDFEQRAKTSECAEWSWFPYQSETYVNTWTSVPDSAGAVDCTDRGSTFLHWLAGWLGGIITATDFYADLPTRWQIQLLASIAMLVLPPTLTDSPNLVVKTAQPNAQHYRRNFQYMRSRMMELNLPIPPLSSQSLSDPPQADWSAVRAMWWDIMSLIYSNVDAPMRLAVEMRIMGDSDLIMAPQRGNTLGTVMLEIGTVSGIVPDEDWASFCQQVCDRMRARVPAGKVRPHWGKEWYDLTMDGLSTSQYMRQVSYKNEIDEFRQELQRIGKRQGWELRDLQQRFSNRALDEIFFDH